MFGRRNAADVRTIVGLAAPFDRPANIGRYSEVIKPGAFHRTIAERGDRVKLLAFHDERTLPLRRATALREETRGVVVEARISKIEALELVRVNQCVNATCPGPPGPPENAVTSVYGVELRGFEPLTSCMPCKRSTN